VIIKIVTQNIDWQAERLDGVTNAHWLQWAGTNLGADLMILPEAYVRPPRAFTDAGWAVAFRPGGFPGTSGWCTLIAARGIAIRRITHVGPNDSYELDTHFPGSLIAADSWIDGEYFATIIGLHVRYRKDKEGKFIGDPRQDLHTMLPDFGAILADRQAPLVIAGDLNVPMYDLPHGFQYLATGELALMDPFAQLNPMTFQHREGDRSQFKMDYLYLSKSLAQKVTERRGGINDFPTALALSDHAPLLLEIDTDLNSVVCDCGAVLRRPAGNYAKKTRCPRCGLVTQYV
jgi:endonuclease/exonuclease/phosphatase family metal-dependent hydrolase